MAAAAAHAAPDPASLPAAPAAQDPAPVAARLPAPAPGAAALARVDRELVEIQALVDTAYFPTALAVAGATRDLLEEAGSGPEVERRRMRLELLAATAALALGRKAVARHCLERALVAEPELRLEGTGASPRLVDALAEVRRRHGAEGGTR